MFSEYATIAAAFPWFFPVVAAGLGACVGSFLNVVIYRLPKGESIVRPGSHCGCGAPIKFYDNIPVLSWLLLRGRARCCGRSFSFRYPFVELLTAALFLACWLRFPPAVAISGWFFLSMLIAATFIDLDHLIIPEVFTIGLAAAGVVLSFALPALHGVHGGSVFIVDSMKAGVASLQGALIGAGLITWISLTAEHFLKKEAMGWGDALFTGAIGAFCGWKGAVFAVSFGSFVGVAWVGLAFIWEKIAGSPAPVAPRVETPEGEATDIAFGAHVPFGPMLAIAGAAYFLGARVPFDHWLNQFAQLF